jgi:hypothetical protein
MEGQVVMPKRKDRAICAVAALAPDIIRKYYVVNCCVAATAIGIDVLKHFGIPSIPQSCKVHALNAAAVRWMEAKRELPKTPQRRKEWRKQKCWMVSIDSLPDGSPDTDLGGHLVILNASFMLDLSIMQLHRPAHNIHLDRAAPLFPRQITTPWTYRGQGGTELIYIPLVKPLPYERSADWQPSPERRAVTHEVIEAIERSLQEDEHVARSDVGSDPGSAAGDNGSPTGESARPHLQGSAQD